MAKLTVDEATLKRFEGEVPRHVAVIMDGNGRWAVQRGMARIRGHHEGANAVRRVVESCRYLGVEILTLYAFSSQNWGRPRDEVSGLMTLFDLYIKKERKRLLQNGIRMQVIGDRERLSPKLQKAIGELEARSAENNGMILQVAVSYGGREEITQAARNIARDAVAGKLDVDAINEDTISDYLYTRGRLDPDLVIRTSGECRVSNFLLWQIAYSELFITETLWPDFDETKLIEAFEDYSRRQRRFGQTGEQIEDEEGAEGPDTSESEG
ncbi:isoprenyl transferase [Lujinxingia vulgaris]|uniref:Isoprenyl transferase n=1 Tax=Lujinxingia vulgaris TaxID=2600176 RepID=A0A5C6XPC4_9DELT|nr:isoprenyl transferase [Lujinxingia vulgaris]TXD41638.1 isoprenyl transferase [Lujinxingia vulgaris]